MAFLWAKDFAVEKMPSFQFNKPAANSCEILEVQSSNPTGNGEMC